MNKKLKKILLASLLTLGTIGTVSYAITRSNMVNANAEKQTNKCSVLFLDDDRYIVKNIDGVEIDNDNVGEVDKNTTISFSIGLTSGYFKTENFYVKANDQILAPTANGGYSVTITDNTVIRVSGISNKTKKYRVETKQGDGVNIFAPGYTKNYDGSFIVNQGKLTFNVNISKGYVKTQDFKVLVNNTEITSETNTYETIINGSTSIEVTGVEYAKYSINFPSSTLYTIYDIEGANIVDGVGYIAKDSFLNFKLQGTGISKSSNVVVKNNGNVIVSTNGVYSIKAQDNINITVDGFSENGVVLGEKAISISAGNITSRKMTKNVNYAGGYQQSTAFSGNWAANPQMVLNSSDKFEKYEVVQFSVFCLGKAYFEIYSKDNTTTYVNSESWTTIYFVREGQSYRMYKGIIGDEGKTNIVMSEKDLISSVRIKINGTYFVSELIASHNEDYIDPFYYLDEKPITTATNIGEDGYYPVTSNFNQKHPFANIDPLKYNSISFEIVTSTITGGNGYYGIGTEPSVSKTLAENTTYIVTLTKNEDDTFNLMFGSYNWGDFDLGDDLSNLKFMCHSKNGSAMEFKISKLLVENDPDYDDSLKTVDVTSNNFHISYTISGHSEESFTCLYGEDIVITITSEDGYDANVYINGEKVIGDNGVYNIKVVKNMNIQIEGVVKVYYQLVAEKVFTSCMDGTDSTYFNKYNYLLTKQYRATEKTGGTYYPTVSVDISSYSYLCFYVYNTQEGDGRLGYSNIGSDSSFKRPNKQEYAVEFIKTNGTWSIVLDGLEKWAEIDSDDFGGMLYCCSWGKTFVSSLIGY